MLTREELLKSLKDNKEKLEMLGAFKIGIFGSYAKGTATEDSDIDILLELNPEGDIYGNYCNVKYFLEELYNKKVDLLTTSHFRRNYKTELAKKHNEIIQKKIMASVIYI
ncbi:nucleotidyltransferase domain-containing protein [Cetobacterium sp. 2A]|uniref:nucleotidyltransferase family protein n=1 Tax=Cetobacterium sp. 2A TaxID=2754723 RepID=UPI00163B82E4|nr:nucleotidyltransferase domain-containing protein [Cetobacterium sp. 2A]MBC2855395.1 nucleotidyltransferase domain-containing protein [Cetobacterium sp. 2A]